MAASRGTVKPIWHLTLIRESWKINPKRGTFTERVFQAKIHSAALHHLYMFLCYDFLRKCRSETVPKMHIFLFSTAYLFSYWHMPFQISIIIKIRWHSIQIYNFISLVPTITSYVFGFFSENALGDCPKNSRIRVKRHSRGSTDTDKIVNGTSSNSHLLGDQ